jgi:hypothetical protein
MRKCDLWRFAHIRPFFAVCLTLLVSLALTGCGGGGGSPKTGTGNGNGGGTVNTSLATVSGKVIDSTGAVVSGATVYIAGTTLSGSSGSDGTFQINSVPLNATGFQVTRPNANYYNSGIYNTVRYTFGTNSSACVIPLPTLQKASIGPTPLVTSIQFDVQSGGSPPAPPSGDPPAGCPGHT